jgi:hypothetical protein
VNSLSSALLKTLHGQLFSEWRLVLTRTTIATAVIAAVAGALPSCSANTQRNFAEATPHSPPSRGNSDMPPPPPISSMPSKVISTASTVDIQCAYSKSVFNSSASVNATSTSSWTCTDSQRVLAANGLPDHDVGTFPNPDNPNKISAQKVAASFTLAPRLTDTATALGGPRGTIGYVLNGVKIDADTNGGCNDSGSACDEGRPQGQWRMEALGKTPFKFGTDSNNAHVQPGGAYHYHGMPEGFIAKQGKGQAVTLIGWAADGFPIYARYGYTVANDNASPIKIIRGSYRLKASPDINRPPVSTYAMGVFVQDYEYVAGLGDLDECNGRTGVTPEFPQGIYHYYATDTYPYLQRCVKGKVEVSRPTGRA